MTWLPRPHPALLRFSATIAVLFGGTLVFSALAFLTQIMLTRQLPMAEVGPVAALLAVVNFLTPFATAGVNYFLLQCFGREGRTAVRWLPSCLRLASAATLLSMVALGGYVLPRWDMNAGLLFPMAVSVPILLGQVFVELGSARLQLEGRYGALSAWQGVTQGGRFAVVLMTTLFGTSLQRVLDGYAMVGLASTLTGIYLLVDLWRWRIPLQGLNTVPAAKSAGLALPTLLQTACQSLPFALMTMFYVFYFQGPIVIVEWRRGGAMAGAYNGAFLIIAAMSLIPTVIYMKFLLPKLCRWAEHDRLVFCAAFHVGVPAMLACGMCLMILVIAAAPFLLPKLLGTGYSASVPSLMILALTIPVRFVQTVYSSLFVKSGEVIQKIRYLGVCAVVGGTSCLILVPPFGLQGASTATLLAEVCLLILHINGAARFIDGINVAETLRISTFCMSLRLLLHGR